MADTFKNIRSNSGGGGGGGGAVDSVNGFTGTVVLDSVDIPFSPTGGIASVEVQSAIAELDSEKQAIVTGAASTVTSSNLTLNRALISNGSGKIAVSPVTDAELGYSSGVTSAIQTQLNAKQATVTGGASTIVSSNLTINRALASDASGKVVVSSVTATELGYSSGVTSAIQTQLNGKEPTIGVLPVSRGGTGATNTPGVISSLQIIEYNTFSNTNYTVPSTYALIKSVAQIGVMTAPRTVTLPPANSLPGGVSITITDATGTVDHTNRITVSPSGGDTINGSVSSVDVRRPFSTLSFSTDGTSDWILSVLSISSGGTGIDTRPTDGQLLIGNSSTGRYNQTTLTAGTGINIGNSNGAITITNSAVAAFINIDGGVANSIYGGIAPIDGGNA